MMAILVGVALLAGFVFVVAIIGWESDSPGEADAVRTLPLWPTASGEYADRQRHAELTAREAA